MTDAKTNETRGRCLWTVDTPINNSPHYHDTIKKQPQICDSILDAIGNTPLVRLTRISKIYGIECELLGKCEFLNPGGSVKDRIGHRMIEDAERTGQIQPGDTLIEPTSGNTGIGLALSAAVKGYRCIITLPEKMSQEKVDILQALGAEVIRTPTEAAWDSPDSLIGVAKRLHTNIPHSHILDQYGNASNPLSHYDCTAEELLQQCDNNIDAIVIAAGTGGTITGIGRKIRERLPKCKIIGVDPHGSLLAFPDALNSIKGSYKVEGIGYDFVPSVLDRTLVDEWVKTNDKDSFNLARQLIRDEGLLVGGSAGSALSGALLVAKRYARGQRVVVILADNVRNYMSKFLNDGWMEQFNFKEVEHDKLPTEWWSAHRVDVLTLTAPVVIRPDMLIRDAVAAFQKHKCDQVPVVEMSGAIIGVVTLDKLTRYLTGGQSRFNLGVSNVVERQFRVVSTDTTLATLSHIFNHNRFILVVEPGREMHFLGVVTPIDLITYIDNQSPSK